MNKRPEQITGARLDEQVAKNYHWNFMLNLFNLVFFVTGMSFVSINTVLPAFVRRLTSSNFLIGLVPCLYDLGLFLPQILIASFTQKLRKKKNLVLLTEPGSMIPWLFLFLAAMVISSSSLSVLLIVFFILHAISSFSRGLGTPAWQDMIAKVIPLKKRGRFFGLSYFLAAGLAIPAASLSIYVLRRFPFPRNFAFCFLLAFIVMSVSYPFLFAVREPAGPVNTKKSSFRAYFRQLPRLIRGDKNFSSFLISMILLSLKDMATAFFAVHAMNKLSLPDSQIGVFTLLLFVGQSISSILWGYLGDKRGYKLVIILGTALTIVAIFLALVSSSIYLFYAVFLIFGSAVGASFVSSLAIVLEFSTAELRPTYVAVANTVRAPFVSLSPLLGGILADRFSFPLVFVLTIFVLLGGALYFTFFVREPRHLPAHFPGRYLAKRRL